MSKPKRGLKGRRSERRTSALEHLPPSSTTPLSGRVASVLTESDVSTLHAGTLQVLENTGVRFDDEEALAIFNAHPDATVDGNVVRFRPRLVEWAIEKTPSKYTLHARNPKYDLAMGEGNVYYTSGFGATFYADLERQVYRKATLDDLHDYYILADYLQNVHYLLMAFVPQDVEPEFAELYAIAVQLNSTEKHVGLSTPTAHFIDEILTMGELVRDSVGAEGPVFHWGMTANSPLTYSDEMTPKAIKCSASGIPFRISCGPLAGATAPVTLAGTLVVQNAEILAGLTLCQLVNPGTVVIYGTFGGAMDMRSGKWAAAGPELALMNAATGQLCKMYGIPLGYGTGGIGDSRTPDVQAGAEKALSILFTALCGVEVIHHGVSGNLAGAMATNFEQLVIDNEIADMVNKMMRGFKVDANSMALDLIHTVGHGNHYLDQSHTMDHFMQEHYMSPLFSRQYQLEWPASEEETLLGRTREKVRQILGQHRPPELDRTVQARIQDIIDKVTGGGRRVFK